MYSAAIENFIDSMHGPHLDNARTCYTTNRDTKPVSPVTNFVFETFLFNSLYSVDWANTVDNDRLTWPDTEGNNRVSESQKQRRFLRFAWDRLAANDTLRNDIFRTLVSLGDFGEDWTTVKPDSRIKEEDGRKFFANLGRIASFASNDQLKSDQDYFQLIEDCRHFVYLIRNNVFHGQKSLGQIWDRNQKRRIRAYDLFLRCLNSMFFAAMGKEDYGSALAQFPMSLSCDGDDVELSSEELVKLTSGRFPSMKTEDSYLHFELSRAGLVSQANEPSGALFYPSAGSDVLFPLIVGLPYCKEFYFFDIADKFKAGSIGRRLRSLGVKEVIQLESANKDIETFEFEFNSRSRKIHLCTMQNTEFLNMDTSVSVYFHRGDSPGEGGSGQEWDSEYFDKLIEKSKGSLLVVSDGEPGGFAEPNLSQLHKVYPPNSHRKRRYYFGKLKQATS